MCGSVLKELQEECRRLLQQEDLLRAQWRHELAIKRQNEETKQRQMEENQHIIARSVIHIVYCHRWLRCHWSCLKTSTSLHGL